MLPRCGRSDNVRTWRLEPRIPPVPEQRLRLYRLRSLSGLIFPSCSRSPTDTDYSSPLFRRTKMAPHPLTSFILFSLSVSLSLPLSVCCRRSLGPRISTSGSRSRLTVESRRRKGRRQPRGNGSVAGRVHLWLTPRGGRRLARLRLPWEELRQGS